MLEQHQLAPQILEAQQWFDTYYGEKVKTRMSFGKTERLRDITPDWESACVYNKREQQTVEVPIISNVTPRIADEETFMHIMDGERIDSINYARLVIETNYATGKTRGFIMTFMGSYKFLTSGKSLSSNSYLYRDSNLDGSVFFQTIEGIFVNGWIYKDGAIAAKLLPQNRIRTRNMEEYEEEYTAQSKSECYTTWVETNEVEIILGPNGYEIPEVEIVCPRKEEKGGGDGGGGTFTEPNFPDDNKGGMDHYGEGRGEESNSGNNNPSDDPIDHSEDEKKSPCKRAAELSTNNRLRTKINQFIRSIDPAGREDGWIRTNGGHELTPSSRTATSLDYDLSQLNQEGIVEQYHIHPRGSLRPSWGDLRKIAFEYKKGYLDLGEFSYGIITDMGCTTLVITSEADFATFANEVWNETLAEKYEKLKQDERQSMDAILSRFIEFLDQNNAGIDVLFNQSVERNRILQLDDQWDAKDSDKNYSNGALSYSTKSKECP
jgi:proteasome lid subunit RPN8/RPN11